MERQLVEDYRAAINQVLARIGALGINATRETALAIARLPEQIRGYGHVKAESVAGARVRWARLLEQLAAAGDEEVVATPMVAPAQA
jgi:indolepyruvate ferredoxin oxidoreductase